MRLLCFTLLFLVSSYAYTAPLVRVLLEEQAKVVTFKSEYPVTFSTASSNVEINYPKTRYKLSKKKGTWLISVQSMKHVEEHRLQGQILSIKSRSLSWNKKDVTFPVSLVYKDKKYQFIGHLGLESYLRGVVPHEMPASWPLAALKAQAVASRSYVFWKMERQKSKDYDVKSSIFDQVFKLEDPNFTSARVETAILATREQVLFDPKNRIMKSYFHSDCGGHTESSHEIWGRRDMVSQGVRDKSCGQRKRSQWVSEWSSQRIMEKVAKEYYLPLDLKLKNIFVRTKLKSQRVKSIDLVFTKGILKRLSGEDIRRLLGYGKLKSTLFEIKKNGNLWTFHGRGFGHGVGLCQWGARAMATSGKSYQAILAHYYSMASLDAYTNSKKDLVSFLNQ